MAEEGLRIAETVNHPFSLIEACYGVSVVYLRQGDVQRAIPVLERAMGLCQDWHIPLFVPRQAAALGLAYALDGRVAAGLALVEHGVEQAGRQGQTEVSGARGRLPQRGVSAGWPPGRRARHAPRRRSISPASTSNAATRPGRCGSWARARRARRPQRASPPPATTARPSPWPRSWACARSRRTATAAWARCMPRPASGSRPVPSCRRLIEMYRGMEMTFWLPETEAALAQVEGR